MTSLRTHTPQRDRTSQQTMHHPGARTLFELTVAALVLSACAGEAPTIAPDDVLLYGAGANMSGWSPATPITTINTPTATEGCPFITKSGDVMYLASNRLGGFGALDLYVSYLDRATGTWSTPVNLGPSVNTANAEQCPLVLNSGKELIFVSDRPGGAGGLDLWMATRDDHRDDFAWGSAVNLTTLNTSAAEFGPGAYEDESGATVLYFNSNRPGGAGGHDLYSSTRPEGGTFSAPVPVTELNTAAAEEFAALSKDGLEIFFSSSRPGGFGALDLWHATRETTSDPWGTPENLGANVNTAAAEGRSTISWDGMTLIFHSNRTGSVDLYQSTRTRSRGGKN